MRLQAAAVGLRAVLWLAAVAVLLVAIGWGSAFVRQGEARLATLPERVHSALERHHSPFVPFSALPRDLMAATISVEDQSFWTNPGISFEGTARALLVDLSTLSFAQGGSTITQQLVRDQLLGFRKTLGRKLTGTIYSLLLTRRMSKPEILTLYLNEVTYGPNIYGIAAASRHYFGVAPQALTLAQCTLLAGLPQDPAGLDPFRNPRAARVRQGEVVHAMVQTGALTAAAANAVLAAPWGLVAHAGGGAAAAHPAAPKGPPATAG